jgi:tetratricopeptide (TPR) repeat protein
MAIEIDPSEALDALGLPQENEMIRETADSELLPLCREATQNLEADSASSPAREVALAALYSLAGDQNAALQAYQRIDTARTNMGSSASLFAQAMNAIHQHRYDDAEPLLLRWLAIHPDDSAARYDLILTRRNISIAAVTRLLAVAPDSYHVHQLLGQLYVSREEDDKALTEYLAVASARPDLPGVHFWLGHLYWKHGDADHAITELTRELELSPGHPEAEAELGTVLVAEERAAEAIPHLQSAIRSKPDLWPAYAQLGRAYAMQKNYARAEEVLKQAQAHDQDASTHYQLALVLRAEGKTAQAAQVFAEVRAIKTEKMAAPSTEDAAVEGSSSGGGKQ